MTNGVTGIPVQQVPANSYTIGQQREGARGTGADASAREQNPRTAVAAGNGGNTTATRGTLINITA